MTRTNTESQHRASRIALGASLGSLSFLEAEEVAIARGEGSRVWGLEARVTRTARSTGSWRRSTMRAVRLADAGTGGEGKPCERR